MFAMLIIIYLSKSMENLRQSKLLLGIAVMYSLTVIALFISALVLSTNLLNLCYFS